MKVNLNDLSPWADVHRMWSSMSKLRIVAPDGTAYEDEAEFSFDEASRTLTVSIKPKPKAKPRAVA